MTYGGTFAATSLMTMPPPRGVFVWFVSPHAEQLLKLSANWLQLLFSRGESSE
jgi:hypothetical protein